MRLIALLLLSSLAASPQTAKPDDTSAVEGSVLNAVTGVPVAKASLLLVRADSTQTPDDWMRNYAASSDSTGKFAFRGILPGKYRLRISRNGFVAAEHGARFSQRSGTVLDLDHPQQLKDFNVRLIPQGVIAGRVLDADGEPLVKVQVQLLRSQYSNGKKVLSTTNSTYTNDLGEYRWPALPPGKYYLFAQSFEGTLPAPPALEEYVPLYYPAAANATGAIPIDVAVGAQVRAVDMSLRKARTATVKGRVVVELPDTQGTPSVGFNMQTAHNNSAVGTFHFFPAKVNAAGDFEVRSLPPGLYDVMAHISKAGRDYYGITRVDVAGSNIEGIVVTIGPRISMAGRILVDGEAPQDLQHPTVRLQRGVTPGNAILLRDTDRIAPDRTFKFEGLDPDRYGVLVEGLPEGFYTKSIRVADTDVTYSGVDLTSGAVGPVDVLVSPKAGTVSGVVQTPDTSQPPPSASVVLLPQEKERLGLFAFYHESATDQYGRFTFKNLAPGEYKAYAWEDVESTAWMDPDFMKPLEAKGASVTVAESAQANVQVMLIPADSEKEKPR